MCNANVFEITSVGDDATSGVVHSIAEETGAVSYDETSAAEQDAVELSISARTQIGSLWFDFVNVTQNTTINVYHKIDGSNYRLFQSNPWTTVDSDGVLIDGFTAYRDVKITFQCGGGGAGAVNVPYAVV